MSPSDAEFEQFTCSGQTRAPSPLDRSPYGAAAHEPLAPFTCPWYIPHTTCTVSSGRSQPPQGLEVLTPRIARCRRQRRYDDGLHISQSSLDMTKSWATITFAVSVSPCMPPFGPLGRDRHLLSHDSSTARVEDAVFNNHHFLNPGVW